jgi:hypothetical protein
VRRGLASGCGSGWVGDNAEMDASRRSRPRAGRGRLRRPGSRRTVGLLTPSILVLLASCGGTSPSASRDAASAAPAASVPPPRVIQTPAPTATPTPSLTVDLPVRIESEPNDYAHRNYCGEGAIALLLSTWTSAVPSIDAIGTAAHVVESYGTTGANAVEAINGYLEQLTGTQAYAYTGAHVTALAVFLDELMTDLSAEGRFASAGHGSPVLVHVMTATLPGWDGHQAQHMVAVYGYSLVAGGAAGDTVTYAETAGSVAGYRGPQVQTISLAALWAAMQSYNTDITTDPVTVIF